MRHGGDTLTYRDRYAGEIIDFSSNINPLGYPEGLKETILKSLGELKVYPDIEYRELKRSVSNYLGCTDEEVLVGNGAVELINNLCTLFNRIIVFTPCFSEYIERPRILGKEVVMLPLKKDFLIDLELLKGNMSSKDLIILGNPNNPTGKRIDKTLLLEIHGLVEAKDSFLLLDEAFYEFCDFDYDSIKLFKNSKNICVIRAATKFFALPGIRLGYGFTAREIAKQYNSVALPWSVNSIASSVGINILKDMNYIKRSREYMKRQRDYMTEELRKLKGLKVYSTNSNFVLLELLWGDEDEIFNYLIERGIMIRKASSFYGLNEKYIRIAIKSQEDNKYLLSCLKEFVEQGRGI